MLLQAQQNDQVSKPGCPLARHLPYLKASQQASSDIAEGFNDKSSLGSTARSPKVQLKGAPRHVSQDSLRFALSGTCFGYRHTCRSPKQRWLSFATDSGAWPVFWAICAGASACPGHNADRLEGFLQVYPPNHR